MAARTPHLPSRRCAASHLPASPPRTWSRTSRSMSTTSIVLELSRYADSLCIARNKACKAQHVEHLATERDAGDGANRPQDGQRHGSANAG
eukprot:4571965-Alexandrium_andersonii.AAC.1